MNEWLRKSVISLQIWTMWLCSHFTMKWLHSALLSLVPAPGHVSPFVSAEKQSVLFIFLFRGVWWSCLNLLQEIISCGEQLTWAHFLERSVSGVPLQVYVEEAGLSCWERRGVCYQRRGFEAAATLLGKLRYPIGTYCVYVWINHRIMEYPELKGSHKDHQVQFQALHSTTQCCAWAFLLMALVKLLSWEWLSSSDSRICSNQK